MTFLTTALIYGAILAIIWAAWHARKRPLHALQIGLVASALLLVGLASPYSHAAARAHTPQQHCMR